METSGEEVIMIRCVVFVPFECSNTPVPEWFSPPSPTAALPAVGEGRRRETAHC